MAIARLPAEIHGRKVRWLRPPAAPGDEIPLVYAASWGFDLVDALILALMGLEGWPRPAGDVRCQLVARLEPDDTAVPLEPPIELPLLRSPRGVQIPDLRPIERSLAASDVGSATFRVELSAQGYESLLHDVRVPPLPLDRLRPLAPQRLVVLLVPPDPASSHLPVQVVIKDERHVVFFGGPGLHLPEGTVCTLGDVSLGWIDSRGCFAVALPVRARSTTLKPDWSIASLALVIRTPGKSERTLTYRIRRPGAPGFSRASAARSRAAPSLRFLLVR
jgi:hypothetical protein